MASKLGEIERLAIYRLADERRRRGAHLLGCRRAGGGDNRGDGDRDQPR